MGGGWDKWKRVKNKKEHSKKEKTTDAKIWLSKKRINEEEEKK